ncbi:M14 family zinc carboxypeptidase [Pseudolysobacter antarcticus]|nr:M14 family zinc carboxypeptidase [Pseudolysobacter antarcticus]
MSFRSIGVLAALFCAHSLNVSAAADTHIDESRIWIAQAHYQDVQAVREIAPYFTHMRVDRAQQTVTVETDALGIRHMREAGMQVEINLAATARMNVRDRALTTGNPDSIPNYACYQTVAETQASQDAFVASYPTLASVIDIGPSWARSQNSANGFRLRVLKITNQATDSATAKPKFFYMSGLHAREYAPVGVNLGLAHWLLDNYGIDADATWLVDHNEFHLLMQANPDGRIIAETGKYQRKNTDNISGICTGTQTSSHQLGVDLNRNFPFHWNTTAGQGSSGTKCNETFRGPTASSEPETQNIVTYLATIFPVHPPVVAGQAAPDDYAGMFLDMHSNAELVLWPWGDTPTHSPNDAAYVAFGRRMAYFNNYSPEQSDSLYPTDGASDDNAYGTFGVPAFTIELDGTGFFEDCTSFQNTTLPANLAALRYAARTLHAPYKLPQGPDALNVKVSASRVVIGSPITLSASIDDTRYNQSNGTQTIYAITAATATVDALPWEAAALPIAMNAVDGAFDSSSEAVNAVLDTSLLTPGKHLIYMQGSNSSGASGPPAATFLQVVAFDDNIFYDGFQ